MARRQGIYWLLTIPQPDFVPYLPPGFVWIRGQLERGSETGYLHWQVLAAADSKRSLRLIKSTFGDTCHAELSRSDAANVYVWKEDTRVEGTQFELGQRPFKLNSKVDWDSVWKAAQQGDLMAIPAGVRCRNYSTLRKIRSDYAQPVGMERTCHVFVGPTGTGKSRRAWEEAGCTAYPKDPRTKFWDGYRGQEAVVIDEFRGDIDVSHLLRWLDRYPVNVEIKGSSLPLEAKTIYITTNLPVSMWYPSLDSATYDALLRRLNITEF